MRSWAVFKASKMAKWIGATTGVSFGQIHVDVDRQHDEYHSISFAAPITNW
jgi:hypothetical protein